MGARPGDEDPAETSEWIEALDAVIRERGPDRAAELLGALFADARLKGLHPADDLSTPYVNTIPVSRQPPLPGDPDTEWKLRSAVRWNALATVLQANLESSELGGHIASYQSAATLYETGFNHFWRGPTEHNRGDLIYIQAIRRRGSTRGRSSRAASRKRTCAIPAGDRRRRPLELPAPLADAELLAVPDRLDGPRPTHGDLPGAVHEVPAGPRAAGPERPQGLGLPRDGETDEPESLGAISLAGRERLDNLVFVINCNLQRLDGPVRGNGKIIQELESIFHGAGWNVIKVIWGSKWDRLLEDDEDGLLVRRMEEAVDGEYQVFKSRDGAFVREHFFGKYPELAERVKDWTDQEIWELNRGGHDPSKIHAAYAEAVAHTGQPTVILAKTVKGYGMGASGEGQNITHQQKHMTPETLKAFRTRFRLPLTDEQAEAGDFYVPEPDSPEMRYLKERREAVGGGPLPQRVTTSAPLPVPDRSIFKAMLEGTGPDRQISTTMAFVRILSALLRDKGIGKNIVPIVPDESRTFGMEGMFRQLGIWSQVGQLYTPEDAGALMFYREDEHGQILQEGINEPGAMSSWIAAATSYASHGIQMVPFYIYYSMFGFQRIGDLAWAAGDSRARGFLLGGTSGRTTLNGEGLQHEDGHSHIQAGLIPNCVAYDPTYAYELAVIIHDGLRRMVGEQEDVFYYLTVMNENYEQPALPEGSEEGILRGMHRIAQAAAGEDAPTVQLLGSGSILREVIAAADLLREHWGVESDIWSVTSFTELRREALEVERANRLRGADGLERPERSYLQEQLDDAPGPVIAATDYVRSFADQIRPWITSPYSVLGTDGYGRSDYRKALRRFFEVDRHHVALAALTELVKRGQLDAKVLGEAIERFDIDTDSEAPWLR